MFEFERRHQRGLELQLENKECREVFERLKINHSIFSLYPTVESLCGLLNPTNKNYAHKDEVMAILLAELHRSNVIYALINIMFWDSLRALYCQRRYRVADWEELFDRIQWEFYRCVINHNLERLPKKIDVNILLNTRKKIIAWEKENVLCKEALTESQELQKAGNVHPEEIEAYLLDMVYKRMKQKEWAGRKGIPHNTVRTLRVRAEMAIRRFEMERLKAKT